MKKLYRLIFVAFISFFIFFQGTNVYIIKKGASAQSFPHYNIEDGFFLRSKFYTSYPSSTYERKENIKLASKSLNKVFLDVNEEFSFNKTVGVRSEERGYKKSKIIVNGKFVDGLGGGVCQVSTTLYNAVLLAGLKVTEYHPHTLPVSYIAPSFDAMVNYNSADLKFVNDTGSPIYIISKANDSQIQIEIYGEKMENKLVRQSIVTKTLEVPEPEIIFGSVKDYPDLIKGESKVLSYGKEGLKSEGFLISVVDGKVESIKKIRKDEYKPLKAQIVEIVE
jgi:vancomycin resistance protein YoaR